MTDGSTSPVVPEQVAPGVLRLGTGRLLGEANVYLIGSGSSCVLVDTAWASRAATLRTVVEAVASPGAGAGTSYRRGHEGGGGRSTMHARVGDWIVVHGRTLDVPGREGLIDELLHADGSPPYRVHWLDDDRHSVFFPGPDAVVTPVRPHAPAPGSASRP